MSDFWGYAIAAVCFLLIYLSGRKIKKLENELKKVRTYEGERNLRCKIALERDEADRANDPASFEEHWMGLGYTLEELHRMADQGHIESVGNWPGYDYEQKPEHITTGRENMAKRALSLRKRQKAEN